MTKSSDWKYAKWTHLSREYLFAMYLMPENLFVFSPENGLMTQNAGFQSFHARRTEIREMDWEEDEEEMTRHPRKRVYN